MSTSNKQLTTSNNPIIMQILKILVQTMRTIQAFIIICFSISLMGCSSSGSVQDNKPAADSILFTAQTIDSTIQIGYGVAIGDVDGDRKPDILLADKKEIVWYRNGDWKKFIMAKDLTASDNVCIAAMDITGDGKVEVAVGAQWNPSETTDSTKSGAVFYLQRPMDVNGTWKAIQLPHEPTVHRMRWLQDASGAFQLVVVPLHGRGNRNGEGAGVRIYGYHYPGENQSQWKLTLFDSSMHMTHNFEPSSRSGIQSGFYLGGKEGVRFVPLDTRRTPGKVPIYNGTGEIRQGRIANDKNYFVTIEPMHGTQLALYVQGEERVVLDSNLREGHAIGTGDFLQLGYDQVVAGWRVPNAEGKTGVKLYSKQLNTNRWVSSWIDENGMACEDIQVADLDGDGKMDIVASGRATKNVKVYWNKSIRTQSGKQ